MPPTKESFNSWEARLGVVIPAFFCDTFFCFLGVRQTACPSCLSPLLVQCGNSLFPYWISFQRPGVVSAASCPWLGNSVMFLRMYSFARCVSISPLVLKPWAFLKCLSFKIASSESITLILTFEDGINRGACWWRRVADKASSACAYCLGQAQRSGKLQNGNGMETKVSKPICAPYSPCKNVTTSLAFNVRGLA